MSLFEDVPKSWFSSSILAVGAILVAPTVIPALGSALRPIAKALVKNGIAVYDSAKELIAEAGEELNDMVAEARAEMEQESQPETSAATETPPSGRAEGASRESGGRASTGRREGQKA
jgi:hypothetical protein